MRSAGSNRVSTACDLWGYCCDAGHGAARVVVAAVAGWESPLYVAAFSFGPTTVLGSVAVLLIGAAAVRVGFGPRVEGNQPT